MGRQFKIRGVLWPTLLGFVLAGCGSEPRIPERTAYWGPSDPRPDEQPWLHTGPRNVVPRADSQVRTDVLAALVADPGVDVFDYRVTVSGGRVGLSGSTDSVHEKERAEALANQIDGVIAVDNRIRVPRKSAEPPGEPETLAPDEKIRRAVIDRILADTELTVYRPIVRVADGVVTLTGRVLDYYSKRRSSRIAREIEGVKSVVDRIEVEPKLKRADAKLTRDVLSVLEMDPYFDPDQVRVSVRGGVVALQGGVALESDREKILDLVSRVPGVRDVRNRIEVEGRPGQPS